MKRVLVVSLLLVFAFFALTAAQAKSVKLEYKYKKGQIDKYKVAMGVKLSMPAMQEGETNVKMSMMLTNKVLEVLPDGSAKIESKISDIKISNTGQNDTLPPGTPKNMSMVMIMSKQGELIESKDIDNMFGNTIPGMDINQFWGQMSLQGAIFPDKMVEVGESWSSNIPFPIGNGNIKIESTLLAAAIPTGKNGKDTASKIKQIYSGHFDLAKIIQSITESSQMDEKQKDETSQIKGNIDVGGWSVIMFDAIAGKMIKANISFTENVRFTVPQVAQNNGQGPSEMNIIMDMNMNISRVK
jgi:hypothetical protein